MALCAGVAFILLRLQDVIIGLADVHYLNMAASCGRGDNISLSFIYIHVFIHINTRVIGLFFLLRSERMEEEKERIKLEG